MFTPDPWGKNDSQFDYCNIFQRGWFNHHEGWISSLFPHVVLTLCHPGLPTPPLPRNAWWGGVLGESCEAWVGGAGWAKIQGFKKERQNTWKGGRKFQGAGLTHGLLRVFQKRWQFQNWKKYVYFFNFNTFGNAERPVTKIIMDFSFLLAFITVFAGIIPWNHRNTREKHLHPLPRRDWLGRLSAVLPSQKNYRVVTQQNKVAKCKGNVWESPSRMTLKHLKLSSILVVYLT